MSNGINDRVLSVLNFLLIKVAWVACVVGGSLPGMAVVSLMLLMCIFQGRWHRERAFVLGLSVLGLILDSAWIHLGILDFGADSLNVANIQLAPLWIVMLWVAVGLSLFEALGFFVKRPLVGALIVGATAPLSYSTGAQFGAVTISSSTSLLIIAVVWVVVFGVVFELARRVQQTGAGEHNNPQAAA